MDKIENGRIIEISEVPRMRINQLIYLNEFLQIPKGKAALYTGEHAKSVKNAFYRYRKTKAIPRTLHGTERYMKGKLIAMYILNNEK